MKPQLTGAVDGYNRAFLLSGLENAYLRLSVYVSGVRLADEKNDLGITWFELRRHEGKHLIDVSDAPLADQSLSVDVCFRSLSAESKGENWQFVRLLVKGPEKFFDEYLDEYRACNQTGV